MNPLNASYNASIANTEKAAMYCIRNFKAVAFEMKKVNTLLIDTLQKKGASQKDIEFLNGPFGILLNKFENTVTGMSTSSFATNSAVVIKGFNNMVNDFKNKVIPIMKNNGATAVALSMRNAPKLIVTSYKSIAAYANTSKKELDQAKNVLDNISNASSQQEAYSLFMEAQQVVLLNEVAGFKDAFSGLGQGISSGVRTLKNVLTFNGKGLDDQIYGRAGEAMYDNKKYAEAVAKYTADKTAFDAYNDAREGIGGLATKASDTLKDTWNSAMDKVGLTSWKSAVDKIPKDPGSEPVLHSKEFLVNNGVIQGGIDTLKALGTKMNTAIDNPTSENILNFFMSSELTKVVGWTAVIAGGIWALKKVYNKIKSFFTGDEK